LRCHYLDDRSNSFARMVLGMPFFISLFLLLLF
jgi:hypothetical protein